MSKVVRSLTSGAVFLARGAILVARGAILALIFSIGACGAESEGDMASAADVEITTFVGSGVQIEWDGTVIHVDPRGDYTNAKPADLILITDTPVDHLDPDLIQQLRKAGRRLCFLLLRTTRGMQDRASGSSGFPTAS